MARGKEAKLRRRNRKKEDQEVADRVFAGSDEEEENGTSDFAPADIPMPPGLGGESGGNDDDSEEEEEKPVLPKKKKKSKARSTEDMESIPMPPKKKSHGIKTLPLIFLVLMTGTTLLPVVLYASDYLGSFMAKSNVLGSIGFRMGMGAVPKKRVLSFYEKHDPYKLEEVPKILSKYYGDYPTLVKKLERKYHDYGYFLGWEEDEAPLALAMEQLQETYNVWLTSYWNVYAPQTMKTGVRNIRYNILFLKKKFHKAWKKHIWPTLEPFLGVPKGAEKQKRQDAAEARKRKAGTAGGTGTRRRSAEFRDDVDED